MGIEIPTESSEKLSFKNVLKGIVALTRLVTELIRHVMPGWACVGTLTPTGRSGVKTIYSGVEQTCGMRRRLLSLVNATQVIIYIQG